MLEMWLIGLVTILVAAAFAGQPALGFGVLGFCLVLTAIFCEK